MSAGLVLINGNIVTMNPSYPAAQAVAISNGLVVSVSSNAKVKQWIGKNTKIVNLHGKTLVPGFADTHVHMADFGFSLNRINFRGVTSIKAMQKMLQEKVQKTPKGKWILGRGWDQECFREKRYPTRWDLDMVSPDNPVAFTRVCGHVGVANSKALEVAGISKKTRAPSDRMIDRDSKGGPTGFLSEAAYDLVLSSVPKPNEEELTQACVLACEKAVQAGLTGVHWIVGRMLEIRVLQKLKKQGKLPLRVYLIVPVALLGSYAKAGLCTGFGDNMLRLGGVKIFVDGSLGGRTAALEKPYSDEKTTKGMLCISQNELTKMIRDAENAGFQACVHAIGDEAIDTALNAFESASEGNSSNPCRHRIEHASVLNNTLIKRLKSLGIIASIQPHFVVSDFWVEARLGAARAMWTYPFKTLIENGVLITGGSDCPVEPIDPLFGIYALTARESSPEERVSVNEAFKIYTLNAAYSSFEENTKGSIEPGKLADFTILSQNPLTTNPKKIRDIQVEMTIVGGKIIFLRKTR